MFDSQRPAFYFFTIRALLSNIVRVCDILGWFSPVVIKLKLLLQRPWEAKIGWDNPVPPKVQRSWEHWSEELPELRRLILPRGYFPKDANINVLQLHGFSDTSEAAYARRVYMQTIGSDDKIHLSLVMAKTKVTPIKRLTMPRLELCGVVILAKLL